MELAVQWTTSGRTLTDNSNYNVNVKMCIRMRRKYDLFRKPQTGITEIAAYNATIVNLHSVSLHSQ